jgi:UDP-glucose 4-epimerase
VRILVTGGAGYIGAHVVRLLLARGDEVVVVDDLSTGRRERVPPEAPLVRLDLTDVSAQTQLANNLRDHAIDAVIHFAAKKQVAESVARPVWYYQQNVGGLVTVLSAMEAAGTRRIVFSSSAAAYGSAPSGVAREQDPPLPINPYGETKLIGEWACRAASVAWGLRVLSLRYFNVAGAGWPDLKDPAEQNLIPIALGHLRRGTPVHVYGDDYPTPDGSCVRDYIHVLDLAEAHLAGLDYLEREVRSVDLLNVGTGRGASVLEVLDAIRRQTGEPLHHDVAPRRPGDPPLLVADAHRINEELGWQARRDLEDIVRSAWADGAEPS